MAGPSSWTSYRSTFADGFATQAPIVTLNCQPCQGRLRPILRGLPLRVGRPQWIQVLSMAWQSHPHYKLRGFAVHLFNNAVARRDIECAGHPRNRSHCLFGPFVLGYAFANGFLILLRRLSIGGTPVAAPVTPVMILCAMSRNAAD